MIVSPSSVISFDKPEWCTRWGASSAGLLIFFRVWRFVRIGHGLVEVTAEYAHKDKMSLIKYAEKLETKLLENNFELPEMSRRVKHIKKKVEEDRSHMGHHHHKKKKKKKEGNE